MSEAASATQKRSKYLPWLVLCTILCILAGAILLSTLHLRRAMRQQIIQQDGITLYVSSFIQPTLLDDLPPDVAADPDLSFSALAEQMLETQSKSGALALRLFDREGHFQMSPTPVAARKLAPDELEAMRKLQPLSFFDANADIGEFGLDTYEGPVLRALIPLKANGTFVGAAEFVLDGHNVAQALTALDKDLWRSSLAIFLVAAAIISASVGWAYQRLNRTHRLLADRTQSLLRANHELMLAAKTSAVGAITAHLIHDLKNPLFGLQTFVQTRGNVDKEGWEHAANAAERMQKLIAEVVRILQEEKTSEQYELTVAEIFDVLRNKISPQAEKSGVELAVTAGFDETLMNRDANIVLLVLTNLVQNAIQATPKGGQITVNAQRNDAGAIFHVSDTGTGLPQHVQQALFTPCKSTKTGGTGLGLAISKHLANHLGAELKVKETSREGTTFELRIPERVFASNLALS